jgi:hypothetical protein
MLTRTWAHSKLFCRDNLFTVFFLVGHLFVEFHCLQYHIWMVYFASQNNLHVYAQDSLINSSCIVGPICGRAYKIWNSCQHWLISHMPFFLFSLLIYTTLTFWKLQMLCISVLSKIISEIFYIQKIFFLFLRTGSCIYVHRWCYLRCWCYKMKR